MLHTKINVHTNIIYTRIVGVMPLRTSRASYMQAAKNKSKAKAKRVGRRDFVPAVDNLVRVRDVHGCWHEAVVVGPCTARDPNQGCQCTSHAIDHAAPFRCRFVAFPGIHAGDAVPIAADIKQFVAQRETLPKDGLVRAIGNQCSAAHLCSTILAFELDARAASGMYKSFN